jgi:hypothetical protein
MKKKLRKLTREDIAMVLELVSDGLKLGFIAFYAFSMTYQQLYSQMKVWRAI